MKRREFKQGEFEKDKNRRGRNAKGNEREEKRVRGKNDPSANQNTGNAKVQKERRGKKHLLTEAEFPRLFGKQTLTLSELKVRRSKVRARLVFTHYSKSTSSSLLWMVLLHLFQISDLNRLQSEPQCNFTPLRRPIRIMTRREIHKFSNHRQTASV